MMRSSHCIMCLLCLAALAGCTPAEPSAKYSVAFINCRPAGPTPYPCAHLRLLATTPLHVYRDPDDVKFTRFRLDSIQILEGPAEISAGSFRGGSPLPFVVYHQAVENIICAPGFNPQIVLTQHSLDDAYGKIRSATEAQGDLDADYRKALDACLQGQAPGKPLSIPLVPLYGKVSDRDVQDIALNHSMLVFLLGLDNVWDDLRSMYRDKPRREAIALVCRTIDHMAKAHREKWPLYQWDEKQERVIDWCHSIAPAD